METYMQLRLAAETKERLDRIASEQGSRSTASLVREIVEEWLAAHPVDKESAKR